MDSGWTRRNPNIPKSWPFFAYSRPTDLLACVIEIMGAVSQVKNALQDFEHPSHQAWNSVTVGQVSRRLYQKELVIEVGPQDEKIDVEYVVCVLAATELLNAFFRSK